MPKLTAAGVRSAKPGSHSDGNGLILRVFLTGGKRWVWRGTVQGRRRDFGFGSYPTVSLKEARTKALEYLRIARLGGDPSVPRSQVPTLQQAAEKVIQLYRAKWKPGGDPRSNGGRPSPTMCSHESATNRSTTSPPKTYGLPGSYLVFPIHNGPADPPADLGHYALEHRSGLQSGQPGGRPNHSRSG